MRTRQKIRVARLTQAMWYIYIYTCIVLIVLVITLPCNLEDDLEDGGRCYVNDRYEKVGTLTDDAPVCAESS